MPKESENDGTYLKALFERALDAILVVDSRLQFVWLNAAASQLLKNAGLSDPGATKLDSLLTPEDCDKLTKPDGPGLVRANVSVVGRPVPHTVLSVLLDPTKTDQQFLMVIRPGSTNTENSLRSDILPAVAHDLKNPLGALFGYADAILDTPIGENLDSPVKEIIGKMRSTASRSIDLVKNYEQLFQLESNHQRARSSAQDLHQILEQVVQSTWREDEKNQKVIQDFLDKPIFVAVPRLQLDRIAANLIGNALKFAPNNGVVTVSTALQQKNALLKIHNTGSYIPEDERQSIFEKYTRGKNSDETSGTGLGLYLVRRLTIAHGGTISVSSDPQSGTLFQVTLPLAQID